MIALGRFFNAKLGTTSLGMYFCLSWVAIDIFLAEWRGNDLYYFLAGMWALVFIVKASVREYEREEA